MAGVPANPKIYHISHLNNLASILQAGQLWSDAKRLELSLDSEIVGISGIKQRRLEELSVGCHPGTMVGDYVPFNFCPRSVMLYILYMRNHPGLSYRGGQRPILHLEADLRTVVASAEANGTRWAFSRRNAGARFASFYADLGDLDKISWDAVHANDFRGSMVREGKQAEFLVYESFPWELVEKIGVVDEGIVGKVRAKLAEASHTPVVSVERGWYY